MTFTRIVLSVVALLALTAIVAVLALRLLMDPDKLRPVLTAEVKKQTGYDVTIDGRFSWTLFPRLGIQAEHIAFSTPGEREPFLDMRHVIFTTDLKTLLTGQQKQQGNVYIATLKLLRVNAQNVHVGLRWENKTLVLQPMTAQLYEGGFDGIARGHHLSDVPQWEWDVRLSNIQLLPLLTDINGADSRLKLSGTGQVALTAMIEGKNREQILNSLSGVSTYTVQGGAVQGIDLNHLVKSADAMIHQKNVTHVSKVNEPTSFDRFTGTAQIKNGVISTNDLLLTAPALTATGAGSINLPFDAIYFQLRVTPYNEAKTQWTIPVMVTGSFSQVDIRLDATELNIMVAKRQLDEVRNTVRDQIKRMPGKTGELLQNLIGK